MHFCKFGTVAVLWIYFEPNWYSTNYSKYRFLWSSTNTLRLRAFN